MLKLRFLPKINCIFVKKIKLMKINEHLISTILVPEEAYDKLEKTENFINEISVSFTLFCAENYTHTSESNFWQNGFREKFTTEELLTLFKETL